MPNFINEQTQNNRLDNLLCQNLHHVHHRKPPRLGVFVKNTANGLVVKLGGQGFQFGSAFESCLARMVKQLPKPSKASKPR